MTVKRCAAEKQAGGRSRARFDVQTSPDLPLVKRPTYARPDECIWSYECKYIPLHDDIAYQHFERSFCFFRSSPSLHRWCAPQHDVTHRLKKRRGKILSVGNRHPYPIRTSAPIDIQSISTSGKVIPGTLVAQSRDSGRASPGYPRDSSREVLRVSSKNLLRACATRVPIEKSN